MNISAKYNFLIRFHLFFGSITNWRSEIQYCEICRKKTLFVPFSIRFRPAALCTECKSLERHRVLYSILKKNEIISREKKVLYFSPDLCIENVLRSQCDTVHTCDFGGGGHVDFDINMTSIRLDEESYNVVIAVHVLEHIVQDLKAMKEVYKILKKGGLFIVMVPQKKDKVKTIEDEFYDPIRRYFFYGGHDHVRYYGLDFTQRAKEAGFIVEVHGNKHLENEMYNDLYCELERYDHVYILKKLATKNY